MTRHSFKACREMINYKNSKQQILLGFESPFETQLNNENRWVKLSEVVPWDRLAEGYHLSLCAKGGRPAKDARLVIGAVIIKHKLSLSDRETVQQIQENPYLQYFVGLPEYQNKEPFTASLFVAIRKRMGDDVFERFNQAIIDSLDHKKKAGSVASSDKSNDDDPTQGKELQSTIEGDNESSSSPKTHQGKLILDATVVEQAIRFPTDINLLNEGREITEEIIDALYPQSHFTKKPRDYRKVARKHYLGFVKRRSPKNKTRRKAIKQQLQYLRRNLSIISDLLDDVGGDESPLRYSLLRKYWIVQILYQQQDEMYRLKTKRCSDRIVSIHQPHVRPIVRGKAHKAAEFGAKLSVSLMGNGIACVDHLGWDAFNEGTDLKEQVELYKDRYGVYPEAVLVDTLYGSRENREYLKKKGIRFSGKPLGRKPKVTDENREQLKAREKQRREDYRQRIPIEGKFGQGKNGYRLNYIRAKTKATSEAWIKSIFLVMNLVALLKFFIGLRKLRVDLGYCLGLLLLIVKPAMQVKHNTVAGMEFRWINNRLRV